MGAAIVTGSKMKTDVLKSLGGRGPALMEGEATLSNIDGGVALMKGPGIGGLQFN